MDGIWPDKKEVTANSNIQLKMALLQLRDTNYLMK